MQLGLREYSDFQNYANQINHVLKKERDYEKNYMDVHFC